MTSIDASQRLALLLRTQISAFQAPPRGERKRAGAAPAQGQPADLAGVVAQRIQAGPVEARAAVALVAEHVAVVQLVAAGLGPDAQG